MFVQCCPTDFVKLQEDSTLLITGVEVLTAHPDCQHIDRCNPWHFANLFVCIEQLTKSLTALNSEMLSERVD